jgi:hypothetical protein
MSTTTINTSTASTVSATPRKRRRVDDIIDAFHAADTDELTTGDIYEYMSEHGTTPRDGNWKAAVRKELQVFCSTASSYKGGPAIFTSCGDGTWKLGSLPENFHRPR